jgi:hypothetical protein
MMDLRFRAISSFFDRKTALTWGDVIQKPDLESRLSTSEPHLGDFVRQHLQRLVETATKALPEDQASTNMDAATVWPKNATYLLGIAPKHESDTTEDIVCATMGAMKVRSLHHVAAQNIHSIISSAIAHQGNTAFEAASAAISDCEIFHCLIRQISAHAIIGDTMMLLLGEGQDPAWMKPSLNMWIDNNFALHLAKYAQVALSSNTAGSYFTFLGKVFAQALIEPVGQFTDELLALYDGGPDDLTVIVTTAAENAAANGADYPHLAEGLAAVATCVTTLARGVFGEGATTAADYDRPLSGNRTIVSVLTCLQRLSPLLLCEGLNSDFGRLRGTFGLLRLRLLEIFMAVYRIGRRDSDEALKQCDFFSRLFSLAEQYPNHDILLNCVSEVCCDAAVRAFDDKTLIKHLVQFAELPARVVRWKAARAPSLVAVACQVARMLGPVFNSEEEAALIGNPGEWTQFLDVNFRDTRPWFEAITGDLYESRGSGKFPTVLHRDPDTSGERCPSNTSITSPLSPSVTARTENNFGSWGASGDRKSRYGNEEDDAEGEGKDLPKDEDFDAVWLEHERKGLPTDEDDPPPPAPIQAVTPADDGDVDAVLGDDWIERTIEDIADATSPEPKNRADRFTVLEEWSTPSPAREEHDPAERRDAPPPAPASTGDKEEEDW